MARASKKMRKEVAKSLVRGVPRGVRRGSWGVRRDTARRLPGAPAGAWRGSRAPVSCVPLPQVWVALSHTLITKPPAAHLL